MTPSTGDVVENVTAAMTVTTTRRRTTATDTGNVFFLLVMFVGLVDMTIF
jgi:hypothetical protein